MENTEEQEYEQKANKAIIGTLKTDKTTQISKSYDKILQTTNNILKHIHLFEKNNTDPDIRMMLNTFRDDHSFLISRIIDEKTKCLKHL